MRAEFADSILEAAMKDERIIFVSGDLGFMALEKIRDNLGSRFINAGVAEQNMVSLSAGLAAQGFIPIVYSIAPFVTLRPFEQLRNDVCFHNLPVKVVGNGGGYGYGIMGATHHALEDIGAMRMLPNMKILVPTFSKDVSNSIQAMLEHSGPSYLRLGKAVGDTSCNYSAGSWSALRHIRVGTQATMVTVGPVLENVLSILEDIPENALDIWTVNELPIKELPEELIASVTSSGKIISLEEHYLSGGILENLAPLLIKELGVPIDLLGLHAKGYSSGRYGSQRWHQEENGLGGDALIKSIKEFIV